MPIITIHDALNDIEKIDNDLSQGHVSVQEASDAVNHINTAWDNFADNCNSRLGIQLKNVVDNNTFEAFGGIKGGAATGINSVSSFFNAVDSFKGSWRNPAEARRKLENGLHDIAKGIQQFGRTLNNIGRTGTAIGNMLSGNNGNVINGVATGIGTFGNNLTHFGETFDNSGVIEIAGHITENISDAANSGAVTGAAAPIDEVALGLADDGERTVQTESLRKETVTKSFIGSDKKDCSADMIHEIIVVVDESTDSQTSMCAINGEKYILSNYSLSQELLQPAILSFSIEKVDKTETQQDVVFSDATQLIGKSFEMQASTVKANKAEDDAAPHDTFVFKGMVIDVSASRATASMQTAVVTVASWDALLQNSPHCRSFENMTLKEIIEDVLKPYAEIGYEVSPRFKEKIPYTVQYCQSDYAFLRMLAIRYGEWMYSTGVEFIFGEMESSGNAVADLDYPGGSLMSYGLRQCMSPFSFGYMYPDHYGYGSGTGTVRTAAEDVGEDANDWTKKALVASIQRFKNKHFEIFSSGGFDNGTDDEGAYAIGGYALKVEAEGRKTGLMTVHGFSKLALLKIGQTFLIRDNVQNKSGESKDVEQKLLKITGINHTFDYRQEYSNHFTAIPVTCSYPSYTDPGMHPVAPPQRATVVDNSDVQKLGRVRVQFLWQEAQSKDMKSPWLRIAVPYAGGGKGQLFVPEVGEEVMVGFEMDNAERPYIIGSLYNGGTGKPEDKWASSVKENGTGNNVKAIRTRNGHTILFNDRGEGGGIEIYDNRNNAYHITLSADEKKVSVFSAGEIEILADGDIGIKSKGNISIEADKKISIQSSKVIIR